MEHLSAQAGGTTPVASTGPGGTVPRHGPSHRFRDQLAALVASPGRRRAAVDVASTVVAEVRADHRGLRLPGHVVAPHRWHPRLDVVLLADELRIAGTGPLVRIPVRDMVLVSYWQCPGDGYRIDLVDGDHLRLVVRDQGQFMEQVRRQIWEYDKALVADGPDEEWALDVSPVLVAEAEMAMDAADARLRQSGRSLQEDAVARDLVGLSAELHHEARVEAIRRRRLRLQLRRVRPLRAGTASHGQS